jgi:hypothetical protein
MNRQFSEKKVKMANEYMKKCSISLTLKEMEIKLPWAMSHPIQKQSSRKQSTNADEDVFGREKNPFHYWW